MCIRYLYICRGKCDAQLWYTVYDVFLSTMQKLVHVSLLFIYDLNCTTVDWIMDNTVEIRLTE
jgi:hypothetical protein